MAPSTDKNITWSRGVTNKTDLHFPFHILSFARIDFHDIRI